MADTLVDGSPRGALDVFWGNGIWGPYWINESVGVIIYVDQDTSLSKVSASKTTDGGATWGAAVSPETSNTTLSLSAWFDKQTPGDNGNLVHVAYMSDVGSLHRYAAYDIVNNTWSTPNTVASINPNGLFAAAQKSFITKTKSGNILIGGVVSGVASHAHKASSPYTSWTAIADPYESNANDQTLGITSNSSDTNDGAILFWDISANQVSVKHYDDSGNTWIENALTGSFAEMANVRMMSATTRLSDGAVLASIYTANNGDIIFFSFSVLDSTLSHITSSSGITAASPTNSNIPSIFVDQITDDIYIAYIDDTIASDSNDIVYIKSTNGGTSWGSVNSYSETTDNYLVIGYSAMGVTGGRFQPAWFDDDDEDIFVNLVNDVELIAPKELELPQIATTTTLYAPTITPGSVTLLPPSLSSTTMYAPEVTQGYMLEVPHLPSAAQLFAFIVTTGPVDMLMPFLTNSETLYAPLVSPDQDISVTFITSTEQLFAPLVSPGPVDLIVTFITSTEQVFAMTLVAGPATLTLPSISGITLYVPTLIAEPLLLIPFIDSSGQLYAMSIGFLVGIKPKGVGGTLRPEGYAIKDGPRVGTESVRPGSVVPLPSPDVATEVVMAAIQPAANQVPFYSEAQYIDADAIGVDADAAVDAGYSVYALQSSPIGTQRATRGIGSQEAPAPAVTSGEQKPSGKIVISIPR